MRHSHYLLAMEGERVRGGIGWNEDAVDRTTRVFELITLDIVTEGFCRQRLLPRIEHAVGELPIFQGLDPAQISRLAQACLVVHFGPEEPVITEGERDARLHVVLSGQVSVRRAGVEHPVGVVGAGECLGETSLLTGAAHSASAIAAGPVETAALGHADLTSLLRQRPDIGLVIYRNLAIGLGTKLTRVSGGR